MTQQRNTGSSLRVGRIVGVELRLHWTFFVLVLLVAWANSGTGVAAVAAGLLWIVAVFGSVLVHEMAHCVVARRHGAVVEDILLTPIGGISQLARMPEAAKDELPIALVGPLTSLGLAIVAVVGGLVADVRLWPPTLFAGSWFARLAWLNVLLGGFNLLPALPMDGGRVLRAALARHRDRRTATRLAVRVARVFAVVMIIAGLVIDLWLVLIGAFVLLGAAAEEQAVETTGHHRDDGTGAHPTVPPIAEGVGPRCGTPGPASGGDAGRVSVGTLGSSEARRVRWQR